MLGYMFDELNMNLVYLEADTENDAAIRCYEKCGFVEEDCCETRDTSADSAGTPSGSPPPERSGMKISERHPPETCSPMAK